MLEEYSRKIEQSEENVDDQINQNARSTLIICGVKFNLRNEKSWNDTVNFFAEQKPVCALIERAHHRNGKNSNSPI